jgi:hypothetical protein
MCHYHEGYHMTWASEIEPRDGDFRQLREPREELTYDLPWRAMAAFFAVVVAIGGSLNLVIGLLR